MGVYEIVVTVLCLSIAAASGWAVWRSYRQARLQEEKKQRAALRRRAILWLVMSLMFLFSALYVMFKISWLLLVVVLLGMGSVGAVLGGGLGANIREHS